MPFRRDINSLLLAAVPESVRQYYYYYYCALILTRSDLSRTIRYGRIGQFWGRQTPIWPKLAAEARESNRVQLTAGQHALNESIEREGRECIRLRPDRGPGRGRATSRALLMWWREASG